MQSKEKVQADFDRVAVNISQRQEKGSPLAKRRVHLTKDIPAQIDYALEVGCGLGDFARFIAPRSKRVLAIDLSPEMIRIARERSAEFPNIEFQAADAMEYAFPAQGFDFIASFTTLHHMPLEQILARMQAALKPGGTLMVFDLCQQKGWRNRVYAIYFQLLGLADRLIRRLLGRRRRFTGKGMQKHDPDEVYPTMVEVNQACQKELPAAQVKEMYGVERYTIVWKKRP